MIVATIYTLCALTALLCTVLLLQAYRAGGYRLLLFAGLTLNNALLVLDKVVFPDVDFSYWRTSTALVAMMILLYGLVWDTE